jgi:hypothetical protein
VEGLAFHKFYFGPKKSHPSSFNTMTSPKVRMLGQDAAGTCPLESCPLWRRGSADARSDVIRLFLLFAVSPCPSIARGDLLLAVITYIRLTQTGDVVKAAEETRIWQRVGQSWKQVHFHRSGL